MKILKTNSFIFSYVFTSFIVLLLSANVLVAQSNLPIDSLELQEERSDAKVYLQPDGITKEIHYTDGKIEVLHFNGEVNIEIFPDGTRVLYSFKGVKLFDMKPNGVSTAYNEDGSVSLIQKKEGGRTSTTEFVDGKAKESTSTTETVTVKEKADGGIRISDTDLSADIFLDSEKRVVSFTQDYLGYSYRYTKDHGSGGKEVKEYIQDNELVYRRSVPRDEANEVGGKFFAFKLKIRGWFSKEILLEESEIVDRYNIL